MFPGETETEKCARVLQFRSLEMQEGIGELCQKNRSISIRSRANVASDVSTSHGELSRRFKNDIGPIRKKAEQALVGALTSEISPQARRTIKKQAS